MRTVERVTGEALDTAIGGQRGFTTVGPKGTASTGNEGLRLRLGIRDNAGTVLTPNRRVPSVREVGVILADEFAAGLAAGSMDEIDVLLRGVGVLSLLELEVPVAGVIPKLLEEVREVGDIGEGRADAQGASLEMRQWKESWSAGVMGARDAGDGREWVAWRVL